MVKDIFLPVNINIGVDVPTTSRKVDGKCSWGPVGEENMLVQIPFNPDNLNLGINMDIIETMSHASPFDFWKLFVTDNILLKLVTETNRYAAQQIQSREFISPNARIRKWKETDVLEMKNF